MGQLPEKFDKIGDEKTREDEELRKILMLPENRRSKCGLPRGRLGLIGKPGCEGDPGYLGNCGHEESRGQRGHPGPPRTTHKRYFFL